MLAMACGLSENLRRDADQAYGALHVGERDGAHLAPVLGQDHVGRQRGVASVDLVDGEALLDQAAPPPSIARPEPSTLKFGRVSHVDPGLPAASPLVRARDLGLARTERVDDWVALAIRTTRGLGSVMAPA